MIGNLVFQSNKLERIHILTGFQFLWSIDRIILLSMNRKQKKVMGHLVIKVQTSLSPFTHDYETPLETASSTPR
jgi:hypothetical protein